MSKPEFIEIHDEPADTHKEEQSTPSEMSWKCLEEKLEKLSKIDLISTCCIYRVPKRLHQINEKAYTPEVISIGPFHHGKEHLNFMEEEKRRYVQEFLQRTGKSLKELFELITKKEKQLRGCYAEEIKFNRNEFVEMILVDAIFIIELFLRFSIRELRKEQDHIFEKPYLLQDIWYDKWSLENQIPFFVLEDIFNQKKVIDSVHQENRSFIKLTYNYFKSLKAVNGKLEKFFVNDFTKKVEVKHFTDFLRTCHLPSKEASPSKERKVVTAPSVIQLHQAGVKVELRKSNESFDIEFMEGGTLQMPQLKLQLETEPLFRNLIAFEQRHYPDNYINDYVFIIHHLVNTPKDVELLVEKKIIENWLPDMEEAATLLNNLSRGITVDPEKFYFSSLCEELEVYCERSFHMWRANLKKNYFNTPWIAISVVNAIFIILLTAVQAAFSVLQVKT